LRDPRGGPIRLERERNRGLPNCTQDDPCPAWWRELRDDERCDWPRRQTFKLGRNSKRVTHVHMPSHAVGSLRAYLAMGAELERGRFRSSVQSARRSYWTALSGALRAAHVQPPVQWRPSGDPRAVAGVAQACGRSMTGMRRNCYGRDFSSIFWISEGYQTSCPIQIQSVPSTFK
jgi:hypothetical protein